MIRLVTGCKINLGLKINGIRPDGYHLLETLFYPLPYPADEIRIFQTNDPGLLIECDSSAIRPDDNLLLHVWNSYPAKPRGLRIKLIKRIPVGAGLGGGSADAAVFLKWLYSLDSSKVGNIVELATSIGADVPFFLAGKPSYGRGIGDKLEPVKLDLSSYWLLMVWPGIEISSKLAFCGWDEAMRNGLTNIAHGTKEFSLSGIDLRNDLEVPVFARWPQLEALKSQLLSLGAIEAAMSGSGSVIYGIFQNYARIPAALNKLRKTWPRVFLMRLRDSGM